MLARRTSVKYLALVKQGYSANRLRPSTPHLIAPRQVAPFHRTASTMSPSIKVVETNKACPVAGPYNQAIIAGGFVYVSGQIPADKNLQLIEGDIRAKTRQCGKNIEAILQEAGSEISKIVKCSVFLDDMANFAAMNEEYEKIFPHKPARTCVAVKTLPKNVPVEIECIALQ